MKLINQSCEILNSIDDGTLDSIYKMIEIAGRTCYKSEDKITETSAKEFVLRMINSGHGAMLEHGTVYLTIPIHIVDSGRAYTDLYLENPYCKVDMDSDAWYVTTNYRVLLEHMCIEDLQFICKPTQFHEKRVSVKFICDRGISHELVRHRKFSFAQESTRYCNYSKDKFGNEITYIIPSWCKILPFSCKSDVMSSEQILLATKSDSSINFLQALQSCELQYFQLLDKGWKPQEARAILPNSIKTEIIMTGFVSDWKHFFTLRDDSHAHPDMQVIAKDLHQQFNNKNLLSK